MASTGYNTGPIITGGASSSQDAMVIQDSLEPRDNNLGNNLEVAGVEGVAEHEGGVLSTAAGSASRGPARETGTIEAMLEEEIVIQETKEQSRLLRNMNASKRKRRCSSSRTMETGGSDAGLRSFRSRRTGSWRKRWRGSP